MSLIIKNLSNAQENFAGQLIAAGATYTIPSEELASFQANDNLLNKLTSTPPVAAIYSEEHPTELSGAEGVVFLLSLEQTVTVNPFTADTEFSFDGQGVFKNCPAGAETGIELTIGVKSKFDGIEILNGNLGDVIQLQILDTDADTYAIALGLVPNANHILDQFGTNWNGKPQPFEKVLPYQKTLYPGMKVCFKYKNNDAAARIVYVNLDLHKFA